MKYFNLDLHVSVIADVRNIIEDIDKDAEVTEWSLSGHTWVFNKQPKNDVKIINQGTWRGIDLKMIEEFVNEYFDFLKTFDCFIVTYAPVFCLLYEKFNKPIIFINCTRYELPFCWNNNHNMWNTLNYKLKELYDKKLLIPIANNKADLIYSKTGTNIDFIHIPSLCYYTNASYNPVQNHFMLYNKSYNLRHDKIKTLHDLPEKYDWKDLYQYMGIIHLPYEISTMSIFEQYSANIPLFFPTKEFFYNLITHKVIHFNGPYTKSAPNKELTDILNNLMFWLDHADFYDTENMPYITYFESTEDLFNKLSKITKEDLINISNKMKEHNLKRKEKVYSFYSNMLNSIKDSKYENIIPNKTENIIPNTNDKIIPNTNEDYIKIYVPDDMKKLPYVDGYSYLHKLDQNNYVFGKNSLVKQNFLRVKGQIDKSCSFGQLIYKIAKTENITKWLEIGTWNGLGSTLCILDGFKENPNNNCRLLSFEADPMMFEAAEENLKEHPCKDKVTFVKGKLKSKEKLKFPTEDNLSSEELNSMHYYLHYEREKYLYENSLDVEPSFCPEAVVLDGGEYSGYLDWLALDKSKLQYIFLDDTNIFKYRRLVQELLRDNSYDCLTHVTDDRNGYAIFVKKNTYEQF